MSDSTLPRRHKQSSEAVKRGANAEVRKIADSFSADCARVHVEHEVADLRDATTETLPALPFPRKLSLGPD